MEILNIDTVMFGKHINILTKIGRHKNEEKKDV